MRFCTLPAFAVACLFITACEKPCKPGFQRYGAKCVRSPDAGVEGDAGRDSVAVPNRDAEATPAERDSDAPREDGSAPCENNVCGGCKELANATDLGMPCKSGEGDCAVDGAWVCDGKDALKCSGVPKAEGTEACGGGDEDCDGKVDESSVAEPAEGSTFWFADCDGDGFAPMGALSARTCAKPSAADAACNTESAAWASTSPQASDDCSDADPRAFPGQLGYFATPIVGTFGDFDFNCDGVETADFAFPNMNEKTGSGCQSYPIGWILAIDAERCYDHQTGYAEACGQLFSVLNAGFETSNNTALECGDSGTVCKWTYDTTIACR